jgi:hypothetical protein
MATHPKNLEQSMRATDTFDAAAWLADWSDHGGIVATIGDRLWIGRAPCLDRNAAQRLDSLRGGIMHPEAATALRRALRGNLAEVES